MNQLLLFGFLCALAPCLLASLHFALRGFTKPLVYLLALGQASIVPLLVALDPDLSFGSDTYSLGAGIAIALIATVEMVFLIGTGVGLLAATTYINRRERVAASARLAAMWSAADAVGSGACPDPEGSPDE